MPNGSRIALGSVLHNGSRKVSANNRKHPELTSAIKFVSNSVLRIPNVVTSRVSIGARATPRVRAGYRAQRCVSSWLLTWSMEQPNFATLEQERHDGVVDAVNVVRLYDDWARRGCVQLLSTEKCSGRLKCWCLRRLKAKTVPIMRPN